MGYPHSVDYEFTTQGRIDTFNQIQSGTYNLYERKMDALNSVKPFVQPEPICEAQYSMVPSKDWWDIDTSMPSQNPDSWSPAERMRRGLSAMPPIEESSFDMMMKHKTPDLTPPPIPPKTFLGKPDFTKVDYRQPLEADPMSFMPRKCTFKDLDLGSLRKNYDPDPLRVMSTKNLPYQGVELDYPIQYKHPEVNIPDIPPLGLNWKDAPDPEFNIKPVEPIKPLFDQTLTDMHEKYWQEKPDFSMGKDNPPFESLRVADIIDQQRFSYRDNIGFEHNKKVGGDIHLTVDINECSPTFGDPHVTMRIPGSKNSEGRKRPLSFHYGLKY